jgi:hypothetical protein
MERLIMIFIYLGIPLITAYLWYILIHFIIKFW